MVLPSADRQLTSTGEVVVYRLYNFLINNTRMLLEEWRSTSADAPLLQVDFDRVLAAEKARRAS